MTKLVSYIGPFLQEFSFWSQSKSTKPLKWIQIWMYMNVKLFNLFPVYSRRIFYTGSQPEIERFIHETKFVFKLRIQYKNIILFLYSIWLFDFFIYGFLEKALKIISYPLRHSEISDSDTWMTSPESESFLLEYSRAWNFYEMSNNNLTTSYGFRYKLDRVWIGRI